MDASGTTLAGGDERERLALAHHEICAERDEALARWRRGLAASLPRRLPRSRGASFLPLVPFSQQARRTMGEYLSAERIGNRMPRAHDPPARIMGRFVGRVDEFGFAVPPAALRLKLLKAPASWTVFLQPASDVPVARIVEWLPTEGLLRIEFGSRRVIRADFQALPEAWARTFQGVTLEFARLESDGEASVTVAGTRSALAAFARRLYGPTAPLELVQLHAAKSPSAFLTLPQDDALRTAVAAGYYRIPRALNLHQLAKKLGISSASLSERLRRAEGRIITRYVEAGSASPWDEMTLFDETPPDVASAEWPEAPSNFPPPESRGD